MDVRKDLEKDGTLAISEEDKLVTTLAKDLTRLCRHAQEEVKRLVKQACHDRWEFARLLHEVNKLFDGADMGEDGGN